MSKLQKKLSILFKSGLYVNNEAPPELVSFLAKKPKDINLVYGETYDSYGLTIDSIKYYLGLSLLHKVLQSLGFQVNSTIVVGDLASIRNKSNNDEKQILQQIEKNHSLIQNLIDGFHLPIKTQRMSHLFVELDIPEKVKSLREQVTNYSQVTKLLRKTVLTNKLKQEQKSGFQYALEEVALINNYSIKIGPPREIYYDQISQQIYQKPIGLYLKPTYPLGFNYDFFINNPEIDEFGVTPYKAGSNKLQEHRIILKRTSKSKVQELIKNSFTPKFPDLANPLRDLHIIALLASFFKSNSGLNELNTPTQSISKRNLTKLFTKTFHDYLTP